MCDFGTNGRLSDGGVIENTQFGRMLNNNELKIPLTCKSKCSTYQLPFVFIGDDAFVMRNNFLRPFKHGEPIKERKIYTYRFSRSHRRVESTFGLKIFHLSHCY